LCWSSSNERNDHVSPLFRNRPTDKRDKERGRTVLSRTVLYKQMCKYIHPRIHSVILFILFLGPEEPRPFSSYTVQYISFIFWPTINCAYRLCCVILNTKTYCIIYNICSFEWYVNWLFYNLWWKYFDHLLQ